MNYPSRRRAASLLLAVLAVSLVAACASTRQREGENSDRERYWYYAKPEVKSFRTAGKISGWRPLGRDELLVRTRFNEAYILRVSPGCVGLNSELGMRIESRTPGTVNSGFDSVRVGGYRCRILEIHPIDYKLMKQEERELRKKDDKEKG
ncbi:MAG: DUF6491 family protein [Gammaproteobacteria bacterium]